MIRRPPSSTRTDTLFPYTTLFRSLLDELVGRRRRDDLGNLVGACAEAALRGRLREIVEQPRRQAVARCDAVILVFLAELLDHRFLGRPASLRSEERRVGKACVITWRSRWSHY